MSETVEFRAGGYRHIPGVFQYSAGVAARAGFEIVHARFRTPLPLARGFERIAEHLAAERRPLTAFCACELRSPAPFTEAGFRAFNEVYVGTLSAWGIFKDEVNPVARSNVCPAVAPPAEPALYAFSYTVPAADAGPTAVIAGSGEVPEGHATYRDHVIRLGDLTPDGLREKARWVLGEMERRLRMAGLTWSGVTATQVYTVHDLHPFLADAIVASGAAAHGLTWHYCRPPIVDVEYEMDCRAVRRELVIG
ncbi:MAG: hypothetical protein KJZ80_05615 [Hyphomicrobiaceae bacterium]|nr:hypothetical protein [Hyphomicrobiaceae bacterium]